MCFTNTTKLFTCPVFALVLVHPIPTLCFAPVTNSAAADNPLHSGLSSIEDDDDDDDDDDVFSFPKAAS